MTVTFVTVRAAGKGAAVHWKREGYAVPLCRQRTPPRGWAETEAESTCLLCSSLLPDGSGSKLSHGSMRERRRALKLTRVRHMPTAPDYLEPLEFEQMQHREMPDQVLMDLLT